MFPDPPTFTAASVRRVPPRRAPRAAWSWAAWPSVWPLVGLVAGLAAWGTAEPALAQGPAPCAPVGLTVRNGAPPKGDVLEDPLRRCEARVGQWRPQDLAHLETVDTLLDEGRRSAALLEEGTALVALQRAIELLEQHAHVPWTSRWLAEAELSVGLVAAQAGSMDLAHAAVTRALSLDPERRVEAAEARPDLVSWIETLARDARTRPVGVFPAASPTPGAVLYVDDVLLGPLPLVARIPKGRHVFRMEAPLHRPWGKVLDVLEGERPPLEVRLEPTPIAGAVASLERAAADHDFVATADALRGLGKELPLPVSVRWEDRQGTRWLVTSCTAEGCRPTARGEGPRAPAEGPEAPVSAAEIHRAFGADLTWLDGPAPPAARPWAERWDLWVAAAVVVAVGATAVGLGLQEEPKAERRIVLEVPDGLGATTGTP